MNKKYSTLLIVILCLCVISFQLIFIFKIRVNRDQNQLYEPTGLQRAVLYESFMFSNINADKIIENILVYPRSGQPFFLCDSIYAPTLVICVPHSTETCITCIDDIINSVQEVFENFSQNQRIMILAHKDEVRLNSRVIKKPIFRYISDDWLNSFENKQNKPFYFIVDSDRKMSMFFMPNSIMRDLTTRYLTIVENKYFLQ